MISTLMSQNKIGIVLHGLVHESTKDIVSEYEKNFPDADILFFTWKSQNVKDISCRIIQIDYPSFLKKPDEYLNRHAFAINIQIFQAREVLKHTNAHIVLRSRSDLFIHNKDIFEIFDKRCGEQKILVPFIYEPDEFNIPDYFQIAHKSILETYWNSQDFHNDDPEYITQEEYTTKNYLKHFDETGDWGNIRKKYFFEADWEKICKCEWMKLTSDVNFQMKWRNRLYNESLRN